MINQVTTFTGEQLQDLPFQKYGYVRLVLKGRQDTTIEKEKYCYSLSRSYYYFYETDDEDKFPPYYTSINGKLILIYDESIRIAGLKPKKQFSKKSISPFRSGNTRRLLMAKEKNQD